MTLHLHERKFELDSLCNVIRLSHAYITTMDEHRPFEKLSSIDWLDAMMVCSSLRRYISSLVIILSILSHRTL